MVDKEDLFQNDKTETVDSQIIMIRINVLFQNHYVSYLQSHVIKHSLI